jgi:thymidylate kinase
MKIITIIGADASGKDTQVELIKNHYEKLNKKVQVITIWHSMADFTVVKDKKLLQEIVETFLLKYEAHARTFFLMACLKNSMEKITIDNDIVLLNGFFHKFWATEMSYGVESEMWEKNICTFINVDKSFYLKTPVDVCLDRKTDWTKYEQGLGKFTGKMMISDTKTFQTNLHAHLENIVSKTKNLVVLDGTQSIEAIFNAIIKQL